MAGSGAHVDHLTLIVEGDRILEVGRRIATVLGPAVVAGTPIERLLEVIDPHDILVVLDAIHGVALDPAVTSELSVRVRRADRPTRALRWSVRRRDDSSDAVEITILGRDHAPAAPFDRSLFDAVPSALAVVGEDGMFLATNPSFCRLVAYEEHELVGRPATFLTLPADRRVDEAMQQSYGTGIPLLVRADKRYLRAEGVVVAVTEAWSRVPWEAETMLVHSVPLADRGAESDREARREPARPEERAAPLLRLTVDEGHTIVDADPESLELLMPTGRDLRGMLLEEAIPVPTDARSPGLLIDQVLEGAAVSLDEQPWVASNGTVRVLSWVATPLEPSAESRLVVLEAVEVTARHAAMVDLATMGLHDPLTRLPNRALLMDRLRHALNRLGRRGEGLAVMLLDLDGFKAINDRFGHEAGDQVLIACADRIRATLRSSDTVSRLGGDEFVVVCEDVAEPGLADRIAQRISRVVERPFDVAGYHIEIGVSIGVELCRSAQVAPEELLRRADDAMYREKQA